MTNKSAKFLIYLAYLIFFLTCSISQKKDYFLYRFIDHLDKKNILTSPLIGLYEKFERINQKWTGRELKLLKIQQQKYYAISSQLPVLGWQDQGKPEMMNISVGGKEIPFQKESLPGRLGWKIQKGEIEIDQFKKNRKKTQVGLLNEKERLMEQVILPEGEFILDIWAESKDPLTHFPKLKIVLNDKPIGEIIIGRHKCYKLTSQARLGWNKFVFSFEESSITKEHPERGLYIDKITIKSMKDIILFTGMENKRRFLTSEFSAEYLAEPIDKIYQIEKAIESNHRYVQEIEFDSSGKKKIEIIGHSSSLDSALKIELDDLKIYKGKFTSISQKIISVEKYIQQGKHNLEFEYFPPDQGRRSFYLSNIIIKNPTKKMYLHLAKIEKVSLIHDLSIGNNALGLKKKFVVPNLSWRTSIDNAINAIFAPPPTYLEFVLKIPEAATLEFGYGLLEKIWKDNGKRVNFKIIIQDKKKDEVIFSEHLNPYRKKSHRKLFHNRIDLTSYSNKKVKLKFITTSSSIDRDPLTKKILVGREFAYWYNPAIYVPAEKEKTNKPRINIILISLDTLRADHLKCYGYEKETSPNMDRLGTEGVIFTNAFSSTNWTLPAHISLLTSLDTRHHQVDKASPYMDNSIITLSDILRKNGYFTGAFTGGALVSQRFGFSKGFDSYRDFRGSHYQRNSAEILFNNSKRWLNRNKDKQFFLFLHTYQIHEPYFSHSPYNSLFLNDKKVRWEKADMKEILLDNESKGSKRFNNLTPSEKENVIAFYDGEIRYTDEYLIKPLVEKLKKLNLYQRTMIIVTSDHGEEFFDHMAWLHGHSLYNELIRIPLIIKLPFSKFRNIKLDNNVRITDIMPTILKVSGIDYSAFKFDGESLIKIIKNYEKKKRVFVADVGPKSYPFQMASKIAINSGKFKLILNNDFGLPPEDFFPCPPPIAKVELYDLKKDPLENKNIAHQEKEMVQYLLKKIYEIHQAEAERKQKKEKEKDKRIDKELEETLRALGYIR